MKLKEEIKILLRNLYVTVLYYGVCEELASDGKLILLNDRWQQNKRNIDRRFRSQYLSFLELYVTSAMLHGVTCFGSKAYICSAVIDKMTRLRCEAELSGALKSGTFS
jgi:hypothetical protein